MTYFAGNRKGRELFIVVEWSQRLLVRWLIRPWWSFDYIYICGVFVGPEMVKQLKSLAVIHPFSTPGKHDSAKTHITGRGTPVA